MRPHSSNFIENAWKDNPIIVNQVVKMPPHSAVHPQYAINRKYPSGILPKIKTQWSMSRQLNPVPKAILIYWQVLFADIFHLPPQPVLTYVVYFPETVKRIIWNHRFYDVLQSNADSCFKLRSNPCNLYKHYFVSFDALVIIGILNNYVLFLAFFLSYSFVIFYTTPRKNIFDMISCF